MTKTDSSVWPRLKVDEDAPPPSTPERRDYVRWLFFAVTKLQPSVLEAFIVKDDAPAFEKAREVFLAYAGELEAALEGRMHLLGEKRTAADMKMGAVLSWAESIGLLAADGKLSAYARRACG